MARIRVISPGEPTPAAASSSNGVGGDGTVDGGNAASKNNAAVVDAIDRHNRPRMRRDIILSSLGERYSHVASFGTAPSPPPACDLIDLFRPVHDPSMVRFLVEAWAKWSAMGPPWDRECCHPEWGVDSGAVPPLVPNHSAFRRGCCAERPSNNVMGALGYYCTDFITPVVGSLVREITEDALAICTAVDSVFDGGAGGGNAAVAYAVTTHPGHHASRDCFGGYCYLNNAALCARLMQRRIATGAPIIDGDGGGVVGNCWGDGDGDDGDCNRDGDGDGERGGPPSSATGGMKSRERPRVAIIDVDYHCGNGTASIFYRDPTVFFASIHCDPDIDYPWNAGFADQTGEGEGIGTTMHVPLPKGAGWDDAYRSSLRGVMSAIAKFDPSALVVSLGLDTHEGDAVAVNRGGFKLRGRDYYEMGLCMGGYMAGRDVPCVFVQEGGYKMDVVGDAAADVVGGYAAGVGRGGVEGGNDGE
jgi:acetoin utilization deacetylase AcuC-like enzyme